MTRRDVLRQRRFKRTIFTVAILIFVAACGKATLTRAPEDVKETPESVVAETVAPVLTTKAGVVKPVVTNFYSEGTHYLQNDKGAFDVLLTSTAVNLKKYEDQMVEVTGNLRTVKGGTAQILDVTKLSSVSDKVNSDAIAVVQAKADPTYGFTDKDTYTLVTSSASAGTAVVQVVHAGKTYHVKLVKKPDPILGDWTIYDSGEGAYTLAPGEEPAPAATDQTTSVAGSAPATTQPAVYGTDSLTKSVPIVDGNKQYSDNFALFAIQYPAKWFYWVVGEAQTADGKAVSSRVLFSDKKVEYENVLIGLDIAPYSFEETLKGYYLDNKGELKVTVRGVDAVRRTYASGTIRVFLPRDKGTTFIISAIPRDGVVSEDILTKMLGTLELRTATHQ